MDTNKDKIAVIGMACRFPGANNIMEFWENLIEGKDTITRFTDEELQRFEYDYESLKTNPDFVKARGIISDIDKFDSDFFGLTPDEAAITDPQHRVWLETAWEAIENAGCDPFSFPGAIGVFAGGSINTYLLNNILRDKTRFENYIRLRYKESFQTMVGNDVSYIPTKTAYHFNLRGPAINVQTACSTSLVAISQACQSLFSYESDICLAGGVCIIVPQESGYIYEQGAIYSPDGYCRPFDLNANGTIFSNGVGVVVLKRMEDALRDKDEIYAIVSGWALNNDGNNKVSFMAPSVEGQAEAITMAYSFAGISPEQIGYVEAHGTATQLGDPTEIAGLRKAFSNKTQKKQFCGIGSVKGNIGHTDTVAGVAGFIKSCLAVYNRKIPPTIHFSAPNRHIKFENTPFYVLDKLKDWTEERPLIIGISSFGIGGTNAHVIIEEPPVPDNPVELHSELPELVILSAKSEESLLKRKHDLIDFICMHPESSFKDIAFTLSSGRKHMPFRSYLVASGNSDIKGADDFIDGRMDEMISKIAFMFPGQGSQYVSMGRDLYHSNRLFSQILDDCFEIIRSHMGEDFRSLLFDEGNFEERESKLARSEFAQPSLFIIEYALAKLLEQIKIRPDYLIGHNIGEYAAACVAGVFDMQSALEIVIKRGQLMQTMPGGMMMSVNASYENLINMNCSDFEIAADNSEHSCFISFSTDKYIRIREILDKSGLKYHNLNSSNSFHSASFDPILKEFGEYVDQYRLNLPVTPFISCSTGTFVTDEQAVSGKYWARQLRDTVQFRNGVSLLGKNDDVFFLEVGPNSNLGSFVKNNNSVKNKDAIFSTIGNQTDLNENHKLISALGKIFNTGIDLDYHNRDGNGQAKKMALPTYPFKRERHWLDI